MTNLLLSIIGSVLTLAIVYFNWKSKNDADIKKAIADEDKKIDAITNADDTIVELDRLLNESPANRP
tara:strand:- start:2398 stop:2598 length:201 start_codon:yes stop_codon:yes gene_type:complete